MIIRDLVNILTTGQDSENLETFLNLICKYQEDLYINNLDLGLLILATSIEKKEIKYLDYLKNGKLIPDLFESNYKDIIFKECDNEIIDDTVVEKLKMNILKYKKDEVEPIFEHELINEIDLNSLINQYHETVKNITIKYKGNDIYSFALSQTKFKLIEELIITNNSDEPVKNLKLSIDTMPAYIEFNNVNIPLINPHSSISIVEFITTPKLDKLLLLQEKIIGTLTIKLSKDDAPITSISQKINYFSYDTWLENLLNGSSALFITPNDNTVKEVVGYTAQEMNRLCDTTTLDDYQSQDKTIVANQVKALYNALHFYGISYLTVPASFELVGQKVRLPHDTILYKQGNCLDISLLFASCLESIGLNPILITLHGHALVGVFLEENNFKTLVYDDVSKLLEMNQEENNEILLIESTLICAHSSSTFEEACAEGRRKVLDSLMDSSFAAIDIKRARAQGFLPLPINYDNFNRTIVDYEILDLNKTKLYRKDFGFKGDRIELTESQMNKFDIWEKKLLDLSKRNPLISYKYNGKGLQFNNYNLNTIYQALKSKGTQFTLVCGETINSNIFELPAISVEKHKMLENDFKAKRLEYIIRNSQQKYSLKYFEKERRRSFEETGSNILYVAVGFVQYYDSARSINPLYAPLILVPVDLKRHSKDNYSLIGREEPPFLNISIFEYFYQEYGCDFNDLLTAPFFENENTNVDVILNTISEKLKQVERTAIIRASVLATFNFSKAVLWSDIKYRRNDLIKNKIIKSIIDKKYKHDEIDLLKPVDVNAYTPSDLAIPLPADSSQIEAIVDCERGKNFILQGPPGTGKSQTITNMIVNSIFHNKTVLFVAEKMAALEVVQRRLNELCLGSFVLEAHSAKADKTSVMLQFDKRVKLGFTSANVEEFKDQAKKIEEERKELNKIINYLHTKRGYLFSFYDAFVNYLNLETIEESITIPEKYIKTLSLKEFSEDSIQIDRLDNAIRTVNGYRNNQFIFYRNPIYKIGKTKHEFLTSANAYKNQLNNVIKTLKAFYKDNKINIPQTQESELALIDLIADKSLNSALSTLFDSNCKVNGKKVDDIIRLGLKFQTYISDLTANFKYEILNYDYKQDYVTLKSSSDANKIKKHFMLKQLTKKISSFAKKGDKYEFDLNEVFESLENFNKKRTELQDLINKYLSDFTEYPTNDILKFNFEDFSNKYNLTKDLIKKYVKPIGLDNLKIINDKFDKLAHKKELLAVYKDLVKLEETLSKQKFDFSYRFKYSINFDCLSKIFTSAISQADYLNNWCRLINVLETFKKSSLEFVAKYVETNDYNNSLELIFKKSLYKYIVVKSMEESETYSFNSEEIATHIAYYKEILRKFKELTIKETASKISIKMPSINDNSPNSSEQGILNKAIKNRCRGKSIRQLFFEIKNILTRVFPVFLMSPISTAQYLSPEMPKFDIVIFDEASQMPTSEAIGAISRGKSLIVVGDSKQLPPTSFFKIKGEETDVDLDDQQSILDDCEVIELPTRRLNWHYRSKHESLIRFSNCKFYNNSLITFPSPNDIVNKITLCNTNGVYGEKGTTNEIEAVAIVNEIARRLKNPFLRQKSIGVVTFSSQQQDKIEDLLNDFFSKNRDLEKYNNECKEPIIIKNLENIQGDERDVILFSICYGPDASGKMNFRFGPINNVGGEKRLNVAISRARYEMVVYTSFDPRILRDMKTDSLGAIELYNFLKYAKNGQEDLVVPNGVSIEERTGIEKFIAQSLIEKGYQVRCNIGKSAFKVNIGIINPNNPNEYILGIICDSYSYENIKTPNDRNIILPNVLSDLGWNLYYVYSFDYYDNPNLVISNIVARIEDIITHPNQYKVKKDNQDKLDITFETREAENTNYSRPYVAYNKLNQIFGTFNDNIYTKTKIVQEILEVEAPISFELLKTRFTAAVGSTRATTNIQNDLIRALQKIKAKSNRDFSNTKYFYWLDDQSFDLDYYRTGGDIIREVDDIPKEEMFVAMKEILINHGKIDIEDLKKSVANLFKIKNVTKNVDLAVRDTISFYSTKGELNFKDNKITLKDKSTEMNKKN